MNREEAKINGLKTYNGKSCKNCGTTEKFVSNWSCVSCTTNSTKNRSPKVYEKYIKSEKGQTWKKEYRRSEVYKEVQKRWRDSSGYARSMSAKRRKYIKEQIDLLTEEELNQILQIYKIATQLTQTTGKRYDVDHIIRVADGGRHHPDNLQVILNDDHILKTASENRKY